ncbi:MAG: hypothetical protein GY844_18035 [Bradyrhizobium sp.]|nr:hypothetical protein [Bradyrhizobium sp.]
MLWYVYPLAIFATVFLGHVAVELVGRPMRSALSVRRKALDRMLFFASIAPPKPRELAVSSQAIHEYDLAVRNVREAECTFRDLGMQLLVLGESEPTLRVLLNFLGLNVVRAGHALVHLSQAYAMAKIDNDAIRRAIGQALHAANAALGASRRRSRNDLIKIRLEPMYLREVGYQKYRGRLGRPPVVSRRVARNPRQGAEAIRPAHGKSMLNAAGRMQASSAAAP